MVQVSQRFGNVLVRGESLVTVGSEKHALPTRCQACAACNGGSNNACKKASAPPKTLIQRSAFFSKKVRTYKEHFNMEAKPRKTLANSSKTLDKHRS